MFLTMIGPRNVTLFITLEISLRKVFVNCYKSNVDFYTHDEIQFYCTKNK